MKSPIAIQSHVKVILSFNGLDEIIYDGSNTFMTIGYNYLKNTLITSGSFDPIQDMQLHHDGGISTESVNISDLGTGKCGFSASWGSGIGTALSGIFKFALRATSSNYTEVYVPTINKGDDYMLTVEWTITFA